MANTGGERITNTFRCKHHALPVPVITATDRIINATTRLTAAIAGIQEAPPNKMEAIQSLCTLLLSEVAQLLPPAPSILPTPPVITPIVDNEPIIIWNPQELQMSPTPHKHTTPSISLNGYTPAIVEDYSDNNRPIPLHSTRPT
jgi:hypothetical protein